MNFNNILTNIATVNLFDAILIVLVLTATAYGFLKGIIRMLGDLTGVLIGIWVAGNYFLPFYEWTHSMYLGNANIGKAISFLLLLALTSKLISLAVMVLDRFINFINIIPFFWTINRFAGSLVGFLTSSIFLGIAIYFLSRYSIGFGFDKLLVGSKIAKGLFRFGEFFSPLLPEILRQLHSLI
ncbi:MAG: CvpA family protein [Patescibacteria group bacterium]